LKDTKEEKYQQELRETREKLPDELKKYAECSAKKNSNYPIMAPLIWKSRPKMEPGYHGASRDHLAEKKRWKQRNNSKN